MIKSFKIELSDKQITPWGGMSQFREMLKKIEFGRMVADLELPEQVSLFKLLPNSRGKIHGINKSC